MMFQNIIKDKYLRTVGGISLLVWLLATIIFLAHLGEASSALILHFQADRGADFLGSQWDVLGILVAVLAIIFINLFLADFLYFRERFLSYIFSFANLGIGILILIVIGIIINVN